MNARKYDDIHILLFFVQSFRGHHRRNCVSKALVLQDLPHRKNIYTCQFLFQTSRAVQCTLTEFILLLIYRIKSTIVMLDYCQTLLVHLRSGDLIICNAQKKLTFFYFIINWLVWLRWCCSHEYVREQLVRIEIIKIYRLYWFKYQTLNCNFIWNILTLYTNTVLIQINNNNLKTSQLNNWIIFLQYWRSIADYVLVYNKMSGKIRALRSSIKVKTIYYTHRTLYCLFIKYTSSWALQTFHCTHK